MCKLRMIIPFIIVCTLLFTQSALAAVPFTAKNGTKVRVAPVGGAKLVAALKDGERVDVEAAAGDYYKIVMIERNGITGFVESSSIDRVRTRGVALAPLAISAASALAKVVIKKVVEYREKKKAMETAASNIVLQPGEEYPIVSHTKDQYMIRLPDGREIIVDENQATPLNSVDLAQGDVGYLWAHAPVATKNAPGLQVLVEKLDGTPVIPQTVLKIGEKYRIRIRVTKDAYIRITAETPELGGFCQYYPNHFLGYRQSMLLKAGQEYSGEFLPPGKSFEVGEPVGRYDLIRVELSTQRPFVFVPRGNENQGCQANNPTRGVRGGSFGNLEDVAAANPVPEVVFVYKIRTQR